MPSPPIQKLGQYERLAVESLNGFLERLGYQPYRSAGIVGVGGATLVRPVVGTAFDCPAWQLVSAGTPEIMESISLPPLWITGQLSLRILYTGSASSTANITLRCNLQPVPLGVIPVPVTFLDISLPGPAVAGRLLSIDVPYLVTVTAEAAMAQWKLARLNADAYGANDVWIVGVRPLWYPERA